MGFVRAAVVGSSPNPSALKFYYPIRTIQRFGLSEFAAFEVRLDLFQYSIKENPYIDDHYMSEEIHLFIDDTGSRYPDRKPSVRKDGMDCFGLGGVLVDEEYSKPVADAHASFCQKWNITNPLHSTKIRGKRHSFAWLGDPKRRTEATSFHNELAELLAIQPLLGIAAIVHRPGYVSQYKEQHADRLWLMDKTAYSILVERAVKYARSRNRKLRVFFEASGKREDAAIRTHHAELIAMGMPFDAKSSEGYDVLTSGDFKEHLFADPQERTKETPLIQFADLYLYPIAKAGYDQSYQAYSELKRNGRIIHCTAEESVQNKLGIKYSCFD